MKGKLSQCSHVEYNKSSEFYIHIWLLPHLILNRLKAVAPYNKFKP